MAAADRAVFAEIAHRNGLKCCGIFFDLEKFFDSVEPLPLLEAIIETKFPCVDALMGFQMHVSLGVIVLNAIPSLPIRIDASILAGCIFSVPWVKSLIHPGSSISVVVIINILPM